jgi:hypothetical protein
LDRRSDHRRRTIVSREFGEAARIAGCCKDLTGLLEFAHRARSFVEVSAKDIQEHTIVKFFHVQQRLDGIALCVPYVV